MFLFEASLNINYEPNLGSCYERHVTNMNKWRGCVPIVPRGIIVNKIITVDSYVAILDRHTDIHYHIAKVLSIQDTVTRVWYCCTKGKILSNAVFKHMYRDPDNFAQRYLTRLPNSILNQDEFRFVGIVKTETVSTGLIICANLGIVPTAAGFRLHKHSVSALRRLGSLKHHIIRKTWNFPGNH